MIHIITIRLLSYHGDIKDISEMLKEIFHFSIIPITINELLTIASELNRQTISIQQIRAPSYHSSLIIIMYIKAYKSNIYCLDVGKNKVRG